MKKRKTKRNDKPIKRANIRQLGTIAEIVSRDIGAESILYIRDNIAQHMNYYFLLDGLVVELKPIAENVYTLHTFGKSGKSALEKKRFFKKVGAQVLEETGYKEILIFVPEDRRDLRFFLASFSKALTKTRGGYILHSFTLEDK